MKTQRAQRPGRTARSPLSASELTRVRQVARRLRAEIKACLQSLGKRLVSPGQMSRELRVNRTVCHRLLTALDPDKDELALVMALPGVEGLRQCVRAFDRHGADESRVAAAEAAIAQYAQLVAELAGSHARLSARLSYSLPGAGRAAAPSTGARSRRHREDLFRAAAAMMGRQLEARCGVSLLRPRPDRPGELEYLHVRYFCGLETGPDATPLVVASSIVSVSDGAEESVGGFCTLDGVPIDSRAQNAVLAPFTTQPLPLVTARDLSGRMTHLIDPRRSADPGRLDIAVAYKVPSLCAIPASQDIPILLEAMHMREPSAAMVFDVYLHASLAAGCRPSIEAYVGRNSGLCDIIDRWYDQIPASPVLKLLGPGLANAPTPLAPRLAELAEHVFSRLRWDPMEFLGYRCEEEFPLWGCDYVMAFDYRREASQPAAAVDPG